jgi:hypothetical protein
VFTSPPDTTGAAAGAGAAACGGEAGGLSAGESAVVGGWWWRRSRGVTAPTAGRLHVRTLLRLVPMRWRAAYDGGMANVVVTEKGPT